MFDLENTKYHVQYTSRFKKEFKKVLKQGKDENLFLEVLNSIANGKELAEKYNITESKASYRLDCCRNASMF